jgi:hypothetical protein
MKKFTPYEKLSKKEKKSIDQARRRTWGALNPVTRKPPNPKAYNRHKAQITKNDDLGYFIFKPTFYLRKLLTSACPPYARY